jgi:hypothetical protein
MPQQGRYLDSWLDAGMPALAELGLDAHRSVPLPPRRPATHRDRRSHREAKLRVQRSPIWHATARPNRLAADSLTADT